MAKNKNVIIDIDNTLVDYVSNLYVVVKEQLSEVSPVSEWTWDTVYDLFGKEKGTELINKAVEITNLYSAPFQTASELTHILKEKNVKVKIVTNREYIFYNQTKNWIENNNIYYDELIFTSCDKSQFIDQNTLFIFDDSPKVINACLEKISQVFSIPYNWNKELQSIKIYKPLDILKFFSF